MTTERGPSAWPGPALRPAVLGRVAFTVDGRGIRWRDVLTYARDTGAWDILEREVSEGVFLLLARGPGSPTSDEIQDAATAFRYARNLVAAEELEAWLERWGLTAEEWMDHVRRSVLRERSESFAPGSSLNREDIARRMWPSAVCSGTIERVAWELAGMLAIGTDLKGASGMVDQPSVLRAELADRLLTEDLLEAEVQKRTLDWAGIRSEVLGFTRLDAAREALALIREEDRSAAEVAEIAHVSLEHRVDYLMDVEENLRAVLMGCAKGDVLGPFEQEGRWLVAAVHEKIPPSLDDPEVRSRATADIVDRAIRQAIEERVVWPGGRLSAW